MLRNITLACLMLCALRITLPAQNFQVQVAAYDSLYSNDFFKDMGLERVEVFYDQNGIYRYIAGSYKTREDAEVVEGQLKVKGFNALILDIEEQKALCGTPCPYNVGERMFATVPKENTTLRNIYFDYGKYVLAKDAYKELDEVYLILKKNPNYTLRMLGHTDAKGSPDYNVELATNRARAARNYLISKGIHANRIFIKVFGELDPLRPNKLSDGKDSPEGRRWNRRVVIVITTANGEVVNEDLINSNTNQNTAPAQEFNDNLPEQNTPNKN